MKIAFVVINANRYEGTSRAVLEVAERLASSHHVDLWARTVDREAKSKLNWIRIKGLGRPELVDFASFQWQVDAQIGRCQYDIVHSAGPNTKKANVYTIQTVHPVKLKLMEQSRATQRVSFLRRLAWLAYDRCVIRSEVRAYRSVGANGVRAFLPVSNGTKRELLEHYPNVSIDEEASNVCVIPNGADLSRFSPANRQIYRSVIRSQCGLAESDFVLLFSGGDWHRKGLDIAIRALSKIDQPRIKLLVVGNDRNGGSIRELTKELGLEHRVFHAGFQKSVHEYYAAADLFIFPTMYEAFSVATIEAACSGLPVLMTDVSGSSELIGSGKTGSLIQRDPTVIATTVMSYFDSPSLLRSAGEAARQLVEQQFNWDSIAAKTLAVYERLLDIRRTVRGNAEVL